MGIHPGQILIQLEDESENGCGKKRYWDLEKNDSLKDENNWLYWINELIFVLGAQYKIDQLSDDTKEIRNFVLENLNVEVRDMWKSPFLDIKLFFSVDVS